jgi:phage gp45-like
MKDIAITEGVKIQLRGEFFNAFNQVNFNAPNVNASAATFGRITGAGAGREIQLAGKIIW